MKALILAAGLGTRLQPLTNNCPKPLIEVNGHTMLEQTIYYLKQYGISELVINVHFLPQKIKQYLIEHDSFGCSINYSDESQQLLGTGGGIVHARPYLSETEPFLVIASDMLTDLNLTDFIHYHRRSVNMVSLAVKNRKTSRSLFADSKGLLAGWKNNQTGELKNVGGREPIHAFGFSCIHIMDPKIWSHLPSSGEFNIIDRYLQLAENEAIGLFDHSEGDWIEFGRLTSVEEANNNKLVKKLQSAIFGAEHRDNTLN